MISGNGGPNGQRLISNGDEPAADRRANGNGRRFRRSTRYLVTGGAGFIGSHLCDALLDGGDEVYVVDDLSTGRLENIVHLRHRQGFNFIAGDAADRALMDEVVGAVDCVFHLAAAVGVALVAENPVRTIETNVHCTEVVFEAASRTNTPVLLASTSEVYGKSRDLPFREGGDLSLGPTSVGRWAYACSKAIDEFLAVAYWKEHRLPTIVVRLFNTVGPRQTGRYGMVVPRLVGQAIRGEPLTVYGDGLQTRCFCHVADVVRALTSLVDCPSAYGGVFNIGSTHEITIRDLAHRILEMTGSDSPISFIPYEEAHQDGFEDMYRRVPDVSKAQRVLGWSAELTLDNIISDVSAYHGSPVPA
jgi:UDP-glucose 4-epimerase